MAKLKKRMSRLTSTLRSSATEDGSAATNGDARRRLAERRASVRLVGGAESNRAEPVPDGPAASDFLIWQLMDSAFPTGGFAHSAGLEAAWQHGEVRGRTELVSFLEASLDQLGHGGLPFVTGAFDTPEELPGLDQLCDAFMANHVANRASRAQGRAFLTAVERIFKSEIGNRKSEIQLAHFAPVFGACLRRLNVPRETATRMFFFNHLRSVLVAAVRLNIVGPMEAQMLQHRLSAHAESIRQRCQDLSPDDIAQTTPLLDVWQGAQDRLYSRLFQS